MVTVDAGAAEFNHVVAQWFVGFEIELTFAVVATVGEGHGAALQTIGADHFAEDGVLNEQMIADGIKLVGVVA
jgi:hypothetical protein